MKIHLNILIILLLVINFSCNRGATSENNVVENQSKTQENKLDIKDSIGTEVNKSEIDSSIQSLKTDKTVNNNSTSNSYTSKYNFWMFGFLFSIVIIFILLWFLIKKRFENEKLSERKEYYKNEHGKIFNQLTTLENEKNELQKKHKIEKKIHKTKKDFGEITQTKMPNTENEISEEIELKVEKAPLHTPQQITNKPITLYAEKAYESGIFSNVTEQKDIHKSIFKLILKDETSTTAEFEVLDTDFILKLAANSPDTYLYSVCKPENSNQNFSGHIITIKKGVAHKVKGKWVIKNDNKATIKFQ